MGWLSQEFDSDLSSVYDEGPSVKKGRKKSKDNNEVSETYSRHPSVRSDGC